MSRYQLRLGGNGPEPQGVRAPGSALQFTSESTPPEYQPVLTPGNYPRLSNVFFVDQGTVVPLALQDGSIGRPFGTLTQALAVANPGRTIVATPGDYSAEGVLDLQCNLQCWLSGLVPFGLFAAQPRVTLAGINHGPGGANVALQDVECPAVQVNLGLSATNSFLGAVNAGGPVRLERCSTLGAVTCLDAFDSDRCTHENLDLTVQDATAPVADFRQASFVGTPAVEFTGAVGTMAIDDFTAYTLQSALFSQPTNGQKALRLGAQQFVRLWVANAFIPGPPAQPGVIYNQTTPIVGGAQVRWDVPIANRQFMGTNWFELAASAQGPVTFVGPASVGAPILFRVEYQLLVQLLATKDVTGWSGIQVGGDPTPRGGIAQHRINGVAGDRFNLVGHGTHGAITGTTYWPSFRAIAGQQFAANEIGVNDLYMGIQWQGTQPI